MRGRKRDVQRVKGSVTKSPSPPSWLSVEAKAEWRRVVPYLVSRRILSDGDWSLVESYCLAAGQVRRCQGILSIEDSFVKSDRSAPRPHPAYRLMHAAMAEARRHAAELGLGPLRRMEPPIGADDDDLTGLDL